MKINPVIVAALIALTTICVVDAGARTLTGVPENRAVTSFRKLPVRLYELDQSGAVPSGMLNKEDIDPAAAIVIYGDWRSQQLVGVRIGVEPYIVRFGDIVPADPGAWNAYFGDALPGEGPLCYTQVSGQRPNPADGQTTKAFC